MQVTLDRKCEDWIESFAEYTQLRPSPDVFNRWAALSAISSVLQRRCFVNVLSSKLYGNLYVVLVGRPGVGKTVAVNGVKEFIHHTKISPYVSVAADSTSRESFFQQMEEAYENRKTKIKVDLDLSPDVFNHASISILSGEFGSLMSSKNIEFMRALTDLYDSDRPEYKYKLKQAESTYIKNPWITMLAGTTPGDLGEILPHGATDQGFTSRLLLIWSDDVYESDDLFQILPRSSTLKNDLLHDLEQMLLLHGEFIFTEEAAQVVNEFYKNRRVHGPSDPILENYNTRRVTHFIKLCIVMSAAKRSTQLIHAEDCLRAKEWLLEAELNMPKCFSSIGQNQAANVLPKVMQYIVNEYKQTRRPIRERKIKAKLMRDVRVQDIPYYMNEICNECKVTGEPPVRSFTPNEFSEGDSSA